MDPFRDPRFSSGVELFNSGEWYAAHDVFEELWHDTAEPERRWLQGAVQVAVAMVHLGRDNLNGAAILLGEGTGRLMRSQASPPGWQSAALLEPCRQLQQQLQGPEPLASDHPCPRLVFDLSE